MIARQRSQVWPASVPIADPHAALVAVIETLMTLQDYGRAGVFISLLANDPPTAETELLRGNWLLAANRLDDARKAFENALRLDPRSPAAQRSIAEVARLKGDFDTAARALARPFARSAGRLALGSTPPGAHAPGVQTPTTEQNFP